MSLSDPDYARKQYYAPRNIAKAEEVIARKQAAEQENAKAYKALLELERELNDTD